MTVQAIEALNDTQVFFAMDKGEAKSDLVALRRRSARDSSASPGIDSSNYPTPSGRADHRLSEAVSDWHTARARVWATAIDAELGSRRRGRLPGLGRPVAVRQHAANPRCGRGRDRHRLRRHSGYHRGAGAHGPAPHPLNEVGEPVLITTGRHLRAGGCPAASHVVHAGRRMLVSDVSRRYPDLVGRLPGHRRTSCW